jgi:adenylate cyclase
MMRIAPSMRPARFTLAQFFFAASALAVVVMGVLLLAFLESSRHSILQSSERLRAAAARRIEERVQASLSEASDVLEAIDRDATHAVTDAGDPAPVEARLFSAVQNAPHVADVTFTHADARGFDDKGELRLAEDGRWQVSVFRASTRPNSPILTRIVERAGHRFVAQRRDRAPNAPLFAAPLIPEGNADDPTGHDTFGPPASKGSYGKALWSDLHYSELDKTLRSADRRVVLSVQKAIDDAAGHFVGVLKVELLQRTIDFELSRLKVDESDPADSHRVFLCDASGWLVSRESPAGVLEEHDGNLRIRPANAAPIVAAALAFPGLAGVAEDHPDASGTLTVAGQPTLVTFRYIAGSQGWIIGIAVPAERYTRDLTLLRNRFLFAYVLVTGLVLLVGWLVLGRVGRAFSRISAVTNRMRGFDFAPATVAAPFRDVAEVMDGLERAKTAMRALGKYVPVDLVRELYAANREPTLGGEVREMSILFTDIRGFTTLAEGLTPEALAPALGRYLEAMIAGVHATGGTIDKLTGDGVMAFWNAPSLLPDHARRACTSILACLEATDKLFASEAWVGLPPFFTRFGLHADTVLVGHFGAPDRLSYTLMGDGVNLASRLEALGKQYGVATLVSQAIVERVEGEFVFRLVDRVAVKGKTKGVRVYELLGRVGFDGPKVAIARAYERALEAYFERDFVRARAIVASQLDDGPSATLEARCIQFESYPPPPEWDGVFVATAK